MTTPQKLAQDVASRAASTARKTNMRLLGVIENMSGDVFGYGGGEELASDLGVPLLGTVPLDPVLREQGDLGLPIVAAEPDAESAQAIFAIAEAIDVRRESGSIVKSLPLVGYCRLSKRRDRARGVHPRAAREARGAEEPAARRRELAACARGCVEPCSNVDEVVRTLMWRAGVRTGCALPISSTSATACSCSSRAAGSGGSGRGDSFRGSSRSSSCATARS